MSQRRNLQLVLKFVMTTLANDGLIVFTTPVPEISFKNEQTF